MSDSRRDNFSFPDHAIPRDFLGWALMLFTIGIMTVSHFPGWSRLMVPLGAILSAFYLPIFLRQRVKIPGEIIIYAAWMAWSLTGVFTAKGLAQFQESLLIILQIAVMIFTVAGICAARQSLAPVMFAFLIGGLIAAGSSFFSGEFQLAGQMDMQVRAAGLLRNANSFSYHLLFAIIAVFYFKESYPIRRYWPAYAAILAIAAVATVYSGSRKGFLGMLAFAGLWYLYSRRKSIFEMRLTILVPLLLLAPLYYGIEYVMSETLLGKRFDDVAHHGEKNLRVQLYREGLQMIEEHPIVGVGLNNFAVLSSSGLFSHSDYLEVAANTGLIGFMLYFSIYVCLWRRLSRLRKLADDDHLKNLTGVLKAAVITILLLAFGRVNVASKLTWLFLAAVIGYVSALEQSLFRKVEFYQ